MAEIVIMPKQGLQMTEGLITSWLVEEGGPVTKGVPLFQMETDKLTIEIDATVSGTLLKILQESGAEVPITEPIAIVGEPGEDISALLAQLDTASTPAESEELQPEKTASVSEAVASSIPVAEGLTGKYATPRAKMTAEEKNIDYRSVPGTGPDGLIIERDVLGFENQQPKASPLAKKVAELNDVDLKGIAGSGYHDKIMTDDVLAAVAQKVSQRIEHGVRSEKLVPFSGMRKVVASRMKESLLEMAQANHRITVDMTEAVKLRAQFKAFDIKVSFNDIVLRCVAKALMEFPMMNSSWTDQGIVQKEYVNLGMAVAVDDGLIVPVIANADVMTLQELANCSSALAQKAKTNTLTSDEYSGGTFTVSNLGMFDIDGFTAIINPPEAGILAVGKLANQPVVINDDIAIRSMMQLSLTYDHRIVDGAPAAQFLRRIKVLLETPGLLV